MTVDTYAVVRGFVLMLGSAYADAKVRNDADRVAMIHSTLHALSVMWPLQYAAIEREAFENI